MIYKEIKYAPIFEKWEEGHLQNSKYSEDFFLSTCIFDTKQEARDYAKVNRNNYPFATTGKIAKIQIAMKRI